MPLSDPASLPTILLLALVVYLTRIGGAVLGGWLRPSPRLEAGLRALPGAVLIAIVAPAVVSGGPGGWAAALATGLVAWRTGGNTLLAMVVGVLVAAATRALLP